MLAIASPASALASGQLLPAAPENDRAVATRVTLPSGDPQTAAPQFEDAIWTDAARDREIPVRIYAPGPEAGPGPFPPVIFSHGGGESGAAFQYLGTYWATRGYIAVFPTHPGSDRATIDSQGERGLRAMRALDGIDKFNRRPEDVRFVLDTLLSAHSGSKLLRGRVDPARIDVAGQGAGTTTALAMVGLASLTRRSCISRSKPSPGATPGPAVVSPGAAAVPAVRRAVPFRPATRQRGCPNAASGPLHAVAICGSPQPRPVGRPPPRPAGVTKDFVKPACVDEDLRVWSPGSGVDRTREPPVSRKRNQRKPTDAELAIIGVIWERGPSTVREVFKHLSERQTIGYTTVLKLMQIMTDKGLLERDSSVRPQIFKAARPQQQTQRQLLRDLLDRAFDGSPGNLVLQALSVRKSTPEERREIRELLDRLEREGP